MKQAGGIPGGLAGGRASAAPYRPMGMSQLQRPVQTDVDVVAAGMPHMGSIDTCQAHITLKIALKTNGTSSVVADVLRIPEGSCREYHPAAYISAWNLDVEGFVANESSH